jgi:hypothetical protein
VDDVIYVLGGRGGSDNAALDDVISYNTMINKWTTAGRLTHGVYDAACVTYNNSIYVFGGADKDNNDVDHVQMYSPTYQSCQIISPSMPRAYGRMRAVLWQTSAILLGWDTCFIYNFEAQNWDESGQFKTDVVHFGLVLSSGTIYVAGGGTSEKDKDNKLVWTLRDDVRSVPVIDIVQKKPALWKHHAKLPQPTLVHCCCALR